MEARLEYREKFNIYGYSTPKMNMEIHEQEITKLRENYEEKLKSIMTADDNLYFVIWFVDEQHWIYHFGITNWDSFADEDAVSVEVPAGHFAVGKASATTPSLVAWEQIFEEKLNTMGNVKVAEIVEQENRKYFECLDKNGDFELWTPIAYAN